MTGKKLAILLLGCLLAWLVRTQAPQGIGHQVALSDDRGAIEADTGTAEPTTFVNINRCVAGCTNPYVPDADAQTQRTFKIDNNH